MKKYYLVEHDGKILVTWNIGKSSFNGAQHISRARAIKTVCKQRKTEADPLLRFILPELMIDQGFNDLFYSLLNFYNSDTYAPYIIE